MSNVRIPPELRPVLIERIRQLNAERKFDGEIAQELGYSAVTIGANQHPCPACRLAVGVSRNVIEEHNLLNGRQCPASLCRFDALAAAVEAHIQRFRMARAA